MPSSKVDYQCQSVVVVPLSDEERTTGRLTAENVGMAVAALHRDGLVVLENAVDTEHMDTINKILCTEAEEMAKLPTTHFNDVFRSNCRDYFDESDVDQHRILELD